MNDTTNINKTSILVVALPGLSQRAWYLTAIYHHVMGYIFGGVGCVLYCNIYYTVIYTIL